MAAIEFNNEYGEIPDDAFASLADELFQLLDSEDEQSESHD
ncbi:MAG TPA: hypothetical protein VKX17_13715 [Planctomycetota bacterium]|nr:hypothetical protein [Planctomycetota bacterium]